MTSISEVSSAARIVRMESTDWDAEMSSLSLDLQLLMIFLVIYGLMRFRSKGTNGGKGVSQKECCTKAIHGKHSSGAVSTLIPAQEILTMACERQKERVLQLYYQPQFSAGLPALSPEDSYKVFFNICLAAGRSGTMETLELVLADMRKTNVPRTEELYTMLMKMFAAKRLNKEVQQLAKWMRVDNISITNALAWSCLCFCASEEREWSAALYYFKKLMALGEPNVKDYGNALKAVSALADAESAFELVKSMREQGLEPDAVMFNMAFASCCIGGKHMDLAEEMLRVVQDDAGFVDVITYNTLIKGYVQAGRILDAFAVLKEMETVGAAPSVVTFGTLLDACINAGDMDKASTVFQMIQKSGCEMNNVLCTTLIKGFAKKGQMARALQVYYSMIEQGVEPDRVTYSTLLKAFCDLKDMEGALKLFQDLCGKGLPLDEVIFNTLLNGCANCCNLELGDRIFKDMVSQGIKPTVSSISTMLKLYAECQSLPQAVELLQSMEPRFGIAPEERLYNQVVHAALRTRRHALAVEMFRALQDFGTMPNVEISKLIKSCINFNMLQTAVAFAECLCETQKVVLRAEHLQLIIDAAAKKKKESFLQSALKLAQKYEIKIQVRDCQ